MCEFYVVFNCKMIRHTVFFHKFFSFSSEFDFERNHLHASKMPISLLSKWSDETQHLNGIKMTRQHLKCN